MKVSRARESFRSLQTAVKPGLLILHVGRSKPATARRWPCIQLPSAHGPFIPNAGGEPLGKQRRPERAWCLNIHQALEASTTFHHFCSDKSLFPVPQVRVLHCAGHNSSSFPPPYDGHAQMQGSSQILDLWSSYRAASGFTMGFCPSRKTKAFAMSSPVD